MTTEEIRKERHTVGSILALAMRASAELQVKSPSLVSMGQRASRASSYGGSEIAKYVDWVPGEPEGYIDWPSSASTSHEYPVMLEFSEPTRIKWCTLIDCARTMKFATAGCTKQEMAAIVHACLAVSAGKNQDPVTALIYDEQSLQRAYGQSSALAVLTASVKAVIETETATARGSSEGFFARCLGALSRLFTTRDNEAESQKLSGLLLAFRRLPGERSIVTIISDFMHLTDAEKEQIKRIARQHIVFLCLVEDPREAAFPEDVATVTMRDMTTGEIATMSFTEANALVGEDHYQRLEALKDFCRDAHCLLQVFSTADGAIAIRQKLIRLLLSNARR